MAAIVARRERRGRIDDDDVDTLLRATSRTSRQPLGGDRLGLVGPHRREQHVDAVGAACRRTRAAVPPSSRALRGHEVVDRAVGLRRPGRARRRRTGDRGRSAASRRPACARSSAGSWLTVVLPTPPLGPSTATSGERVSAAASARAAVDTRATPCGRRLRPTVRSAGRITISCAPAMQRLAERAVRRARDGDDQRPSPAVTCGCATRSVEHVRRRSA